MRRFIQWFRGLLQGRPSHRQLKAWLKTHRIAGAATNKSFERLATFGLLMPVVGGNPINVSSGQPLLFGKGQTGALNPMAGVAVEAENSTNPPYDNNSGRLTVDFEGVYALTVVAETLGSASAGAAINPGDAVFASGGTFDAVSGITYGFTLSKDATGTFFGRSLDALAAGTTGVIRIILRNAA